MVVAESPAPAAVNGVTRMARVVPASKPSREIEVVAVPVFGETTFQLLAVVHVTMHRSTL